MDYSKRARYVLQKRSRIEASIDGSQSREIHKCIYDFFSLSFVFPFPFHLDFPPLFLTAPPFRRLRSFFSIPRLIFVVARDIRPLSDSVVPYRAIYPASMANGRHIDNSELHTLFTRIRHARAYYTYRRATMRGPKSLSPSPYRFLVPLRKGPSMASVAYCCCRTPANFVL